MNPLNILIVEGNINKDTEIFIKAAGFSAAENFKKLVLKLQPSSNVEIIHPGDENETAEAIKKNQ